MPPAKRKTTANRCVYKENGRRCPKPGQGNPPMCMSHRLVIDEAARVRVRGFEFSGTGSKIPEVLRNIFGGGKVKTDDLFAAGFEVLGAVLGAQAARAAAPGAGAGARGAGFPYGFPGGFTNPPTPDNPTGWGGRRPPPPPQPPYSDEMEIARARGILGFKSTQPITVDLVKERKRKLARKNHPDLGGSNEKMAAINAAADLLIDHLTPARKGTQAGVG